MTEGATTGNEPGDEGGDAPCWAHLFADDELAGSEREGPADEPGGDVVDRGDE